MKHVELFENFTSKLNEASVSLDNAVFQFLPFDKYRGNISFDDTNLEGLIEIANEAEESGEAAEIGDAGIFLCHIPLRNKGFVRIYTEVDKSLYPLQFNVSNWDSKYQLTSEDKEVTLEDLPAQISKGNILSRFI